MKVRLRALLLLLLDRLSERNRTLMAQGGFYNRLKRGSEFFHSGITGKPLLHIGQFKLHLPYFFF